VICVRSGLTTSSKGVEYTWFREQKCCSTLLDLLEVFPAQGSVLFLTGSFTDASFALVAGSYEHWTLCLEDRRTDTYRFGGDNAVNLRRGVQATTLLSGALHLRPPSQRIVVTVDGDLASSVPYLAIHCRYYEFTIRWTLWSLRIKAAYNSDSDSGDDQLRPAAFTAEMKPGKLAKRRDRHFKGASRDGHV
jgi:hypothetical protein